MPRARKSGKGGRKRGRGVRTRKTRAKRSVKTRRGRGVWSKVKSAAKTALKVAVPVGLAALAYKNRDAIKGVPYNYRAIRESDPSMNPVVATIHALRGNNMGSFHSTPRSHFDPYARTDNNFLYSL